MSTNFKTSICDEATWALVFLEQPKNNKQKQFNKD